MAVSIASRCADKLPLETYESSHTLTRSYNSNGSQHSTATILGGNIVSLREQKYTSLQDGLSARPQAPSMPMSTGSQSSLLASLPSFGSVFGDGSDRQNIHEAAGDLPESNQNSSRNPALPSTSNIGASAIKRPNTSHHFFSPGLRRDSASTFESVESSPTTTISTVESSLTEPSPSSSPESPTSMLASSPLKPYRTNSTPVTLTAMELREQFSSSYPTLPGVQGSESPNKKMRNTKNLSVNTTASNRPSSQLSKVSSSGSASGQASSAPPTPAFIVPPPKAPRRKPSNLGLSITTPESSIVKPGPGQERPVLVPQTPSDPQVRSLRALQQTISTGPMFSPTHAPEGGMRLPPMNSNVNPTRFGPASRPPLSISPHTSFDSNINSSPITKQTLDHVQEECDYELPLSQEAKSPAYPEGPVCIYDPYVYLYMEPTDIEAAEFDVVVNVAREVKNPFSKTPKQEVQEPTFLEQMSIPSENKASHLAGRDDSLSTRPTVGSIIPSNSTSEEIDEDNIGTAPSTPKAVRPQPEYIHIPWDHNTTVVDDLLRLCELIDDRVRSQKRILIHCQCGVSRSASLVVAYGLYKNPQSSVQEAYDAVKNRSRWIGPNMNLIYQLSEFKNKLGRFSPERSSGWPTWRAAGGPNSAIDSSSVPQLPSSSLRTIPQKSLSAPSNLERTSSFHEAQKNKDDSVMSGDVTPGPMTAPAGVVWSSDNAAVEPFAVKNEQSEAPVQPGSMHFDSGISLSRPTPNADAFEQKQSPPAGAVTMDLRNVARDLDHKVQLNSPATTTADKGIQVPAVIPPPYGEDDWDDSSKLTPRPSPFHPTTLSPSSQSHPLRPQPSLPAGFSSLLSRRQNPQALPIRQGLPPLSTNQQIPLSFHPAPHQEVPPTPSLLSPRAAEFTASPFHRTVAGDLAGSSVFEQGLMSPRTVQDDPRSPHQVGEAPITRNIFDMMDFDRTPK